MASTGQRCGVDGVCANVDNGLFDMDVLGETPAKQAQLTRGLIPLLAEGSARATDTDTTDEILSAAVSYAKVSGYCEKGDSIVAFAQNRKRESVIKILNAGE